ncbi:unnamed protein product [Phytophthora lilii]|uniref:Unnamed protein product n=1 Tax=Phytophthora lilii TaxID=2077276 RepID=A0A9W6U4H8_9STRA|nr:unnamed protein product [Phytophthora lilii]
MRIHFPEGENLFRCVGQPHCSWSCDNYKEFAQHQKLHHNILVGAQQDARAADKDNDYFSTADATSRDYAADHGAYGGAHHAAAPTGSFLYASSFDKPKSSVLPGRNKLIGPPAFFGPSDSSLPTMLPKEPTKKSSELDHLYGSDQRRAMKPGASSAFPSAPYSSANSSFSLSADSAFGRWSFTTNSSHFAPLRPEEDRGDAGYDGQQQQSQQHQLLPPPSHHVLRPPPQSNEDGKYGGLVVPPPMNPAAPEFTGEELNVVFQLMNEHY